MGFNRRKLEEQRREAANKEAAKRRATDAQVLEDAERLIGAWNERQALRAPMIFSPTIGAAIRAGYWFLWVRCPACRSTSSIDLRTLDPGPSKNKRPVLWCATTTANNWRMSISRMSPAGDSAAKLLTRDETRPLRTSATCRSHCSKDDEPNAVLNTSGRRPKTGSSRRSRRSPSSLSSRIDSRDDIRNPRRHC